MRAKQDSCGNDVPAAAVAHEKILKTTILTLNKSDEPDTVLAWMSILKRNEHEISSCTIGRHASEALGMGQNRAKSNRRWRWSATTQTRRT